MKKTARRVLKHLRHPSLIRWQLEMSLAQWQARAYPAATVDPRLREDLVSHFGRGRGAYPLYTPPLTPHSVVYSFGIGQDASFDLDLIEKIGCHVHAYDPTPESERFVAARGFPDKFHFTRCAVGAADGRRVLTSLKRGSPNYRPGTTLEASSERLRAQEHLEVDVLSLPTIAARQGHTAVDVMKIDVEGAEYEIFEQFDFRVLPVGQITCEFHPALWNLARYGRMWGREGWEKTRQTIARLTDQGYRVSYLSDRRTEWSFVHDSVIDAGR